jgi:hypothetical protein
MPKKAPNALVRYLNMIVGHGSEVVTDQDLLERFVRQHDEAAFATLVERHGSTVLSVCQCALRD